MMKIHRIPGARIQKSRVRGVESSKEKGPRIPGVKDSSEKMSSNNFSKHSFGVFHQEPIYLKLVNFQKLIFKEPQG